MKKVFVFVLFSLVFITPSFSQEDPHEQRLAVIKKRLEDLAVLNPGLTENVDFAVSGASIQEFLKALAEAHNLNISVDPDLNFRIYNNFNNELVMNVLLFLAKEYQLDIRFIGSIMSFHRYSPPPVQEPIVPEREIAVKYNSYTDRLTLDLKADTLDKVVKKITQESKKNVIISNGLAGKLISIYIQDAPFESALEKMAFANQLKVIETQDNFFVLVEPGEGELVLTPAEEQNKIIKYSNPFPEFDRKKPASAKAPGTQGELFVDVTADSAGNPLITLEAINSPISETIKTVAAAVGVSYFMFSDLKGTSTVRVMKVVFDDFLKRLLQGTDYTYSNTNGLYMIGERKLEGLRASKLVQLHYRSAKDMIELIPAELKRNVEVKEFIELNSILLTGSQPQIEEIESFIAHLDKVVPMVMIEVIIMDIRKGRVTKTGISAGVSDTVQTRGTIFPGINMVFSSNTINTFLDRIGINNTINLGRVTPDFYVGLEALENSTNVEVRSTPKLSTLNGHEATLSIGSTRYYSTQTQNVVGSLNPQTVITQQWHEVEANLAIGILPIVSGDDQVTLQIEVNNSDFLEVNVDKPPASATSEFNSLIRVKNEEMIVLGGLERYEKTNSGEGLPLLSRIPILKWIFSKRTKGKSKTVTLVFIKPSIIY